MLLSLDSSPSLSKTTSFYILGIFSLLVLSIYQFLNQGYLDTRWSAQNIVLVHIFAIGFLLPMILGSLTQLLPVLFGINLRFNKYFQAFIIILPVCLISYTVNMHYNSNFNNIINLLILSFLWLSLIMFAIVLCKKNLYLYFKEKNPIHLLLSLSTLNLIISIFFSVYLMGVHFGLDLPNFRPYITNIHLQFMLLGFILPLFIAVLSNIVPMFYISSALDTKILYLTTLISALLYLKIIFLEQVFLSHFIAFINIIITTTLFLQLLRRKRKNKDLTIYFWYLTYICIFMTQTLWIIYNTSIWNAEVLEIILGKLIFFGIIFSAVSAMLLKIIPFLSWLHLSQEQVRNDRFDLKIPHLGSFLKSNDKIKILVLLIFNLIFQVINLYTFSSIVLIAISLKLFSIIFENLKIYRKFSKELTSQIPL